MFSSFRNAQKLLEIKKLINQHSNPCFIPIVTGPMNVSKPLGYTGFLPNANIPYVRTRFDVFSDPIVRMIKLKNELQRN